MTAAVAQRVALYEEDPADQQGKRFVGSATWRTEMVPAGPRSPPDLAVRADIEIPERRMTMTLLIRRDLNQVQQATATPSRSRSTCRRTSRSAEFRTCLAC